MTTRQEPEETVSRRHRKKRGGSHKKSVLIGIAVLGCFVLLAVAAKPSYHWIKAWRSAQLAAVANRLAAAGQWRQAADKYRAALQLDPLGYPALKGAAILASRLDRPEAVDLWEQVAKSPDGTLADQQAYAEQLLATGRRSLAEQVIDRLLKTAPDAKTLGLASRYAQSAGDKSKALTFARLAVKKSPNDDLAQFRVAELLAESPDPQERAEARHILWGIALRDGPVRHTAIEALGRAPDLSQAEQQRLMKILRQLKPTGIKDDLLLADLRLQLEPEKAASIFDQTVARWNRSQPEDLVELARWLNGHQQSGRVLSLFPIERALENNQLLMVRLDALANLQRWSEVDSLLAQPNLTLDPSVLESFRARSAQEQNQALDAELHWSHALSFAFGDPLKLRFIANFAEQSHDTGVALKAYDQLAKFPDYAWFAYVGTQRLSARQGDLATQRAAAEKVVALAPNDPNARAQLAYLDLLAGRDVDGNLAVVKKLVEKYPDRLSFRVTAALGYLRRHDAGLALAQFKGPPGAPPIEWGSTPMAWRAVYAAALMANDHQDRAAEIVRTISMEELRPEERDLIQPAAK
jgi:tetratricopeptide (TPR) repeat protein